MKKIATVLLMLVLVLSFAACGKQRVDEGVPEVEDYKWTMRYIAKKTGAIVALGKDHNTSFFCDTEIEMTASLRNGKIKIKDITNKKTYEGEYAEKERTSEKTEYTFTLDGVDGYGSVSVREYFDGEYYYDAPGLSMLVGDYTLSFEAVTE